MISRGQLNGSDSVLNPQRDPLIDITRLLARSAAREFFISIAFEPTGPVTGPNNDSIPIKETTP
jgi:hypothetical protein